MMRAVLFVVFFTSVAHAQSVRLSDKNADGTPKYFERYISVPAPQRKPYAGSVYSFPNPFYWDRNLPGGHIEICNALVDKQHRVGAWSQPAVIDTTEGWSPWGNDSNQPTSYDCVGTIWKIKWITAVPPDPRGWPVDGTEILLYLGDHYNVGAGPAGFRASVPWSASYPRSNWLQPSAFTLSSLRFGGSNTTVAGPPPIMACNVPVKSQELFTCFVTHTGETESSPKTQVATYGPTSGVGRFTLQIGEQTPMGALGYHIYLDGHRVPAPHCLGEPTNANDWLWPLDCYTVELSHVAANGPAHNPVAAPMSRINALQDAMLQTTGSVFVDTPDVLPLYCPVVDEYSVYGTSWPLKYGRVISSYGTSWRMVQQKNVPNAPGGHATYWPAVIVHSQFSKWDGLILDAKWASCGFCWADYSGGQAFGTQLVNCNLSIPGCSDITDQLTTPYRLTQGIRVMWECTASGHSASELSFEGCQINALVPIYLEHNQTANIKFRRTNISSYYDDRRACCAWIDSPNQFKFTDGFFANCPSNTILSLGYSPAVSIDGMFIDGGCKSLIDFTHYVPGSVRLADGKINFWSPNAMTRPSLARIINSNTEASVQLERINVQWNNIFEVDVCSTGWRRANLRFTDTPLSDATVLREPCQTQWLQLMDRYKPNPITPEWTAFVNTPEPGMKMTLPVTKVPMSLNGTPTAAATTAQVITFNSLTGRQNVQRKDWWSVP